MLDQHVGLVFPGLRIFEHLSVIAIVCYFSVYKLITRTQQTFTCSKSTAETLEKVRNMPNLRINRIESRSGVFTVKCFYC